MAGAKGRAGVVDGQIIATIKDKFGEDRRVVQRGSRIRIAQNESTVVLAMNREIARLSAEKIKAARLARGFTLEELAIRAGMTTGWPKNRMYEIESGQRRNYIRMGTLYALAAALNVEATSLLPTVAEVLAKADMSNVPSRLIVELDARGKVSA